MSMAVILGSLVDYSLGTELYSVDLRYGILGLAFVIGGAAELLPTDRTQVAAGLRATSIGCFALFFLSMVFGPSIVL